MTVLNISKVCKNLEIFLCNFTNLFWHIPRIRPHILPFEISIIKEKLQRRMFTRKTVLNLLGS